MDQRGFLEATRDGYDRTAGLYAERFHDDLDDKPVDLAMVSAFAALVATSGSKRVVDVGCGTGVTTAKLRAAGVDAFGIDLSPKMISEAQRLNPDVEFSVGSMTDLAVSDDHLPLVFDEFHRVLIPGGFALLGFQVGDEPRILDEAFGQRVDLTFYRRQPDHVLALLEQAGLQPFAELVREPADGTHESTKQAFLIAHKPT